ncbi:MAG TPA: gamma-glutamylcyclotransferase family protein [Acidimicrobiales bacterium]|nr:gamma-glutamylcyclotransferase family protein [Acidimicrobiales bacterium]
MTRPAVPPPFAVGALLAPLPLFAYGTLLPGQPLAGLLAPHVVAAAPATVAGRLHWHACRQFPVVVVDPAARTWGLRVQVDPDAGLLGRLAAEELACGYEARWVEATGADGNALGPTLLFTWPWVGTTVGPEIVGGRFTAPEVLETGYRTSRPPGCRRPPAPHDAPTGGHAP